MCDQQTVVHVNLASNVVTDVPHYSSSLVLRSCASVAVPSGDVLAPVSTESMKALARQRRAKQLAEQVEVNVYLQSSFSFTRRSALLPVCPLACFVIG